MTIRRKRLLISWLLAGLIIVGTAAGTLYVISGAIFQAQQPVAFAMTTPQFSVNNGVISLGFNVTNLSNSTGAVIFQVGATAENATFGICDIDIGAHQTAPCVIISGNTGEPPATCSQFSPDQNYTVTISAGFRNFNNVDKHYVFTGAQLGCG
jgi:hypothetical protein